MLDGWLSPGSNKRPRSPVDVLHELHSSIDPDDEVLDNRHNKKRALTEMMASGFSKLQFSLSHLKARRLAEDEAMCLQQAAPGTLQALPDMSQLLQPDFGKALAAAGSLSRSNSFCFQEAIASLSQCADGSHGSSDSHMGGSEAATGTAAALTPMWQPSSQQQAAGPSSRMAAEASANHSAAYSHQHQQQHHQQEGDKLLHSPNEGPAGKMDLRRTALLRSLLSKTDEHLLRRHRSAGGGAESAPVTDADEDGAGADHMHVEGVVGPEQGDGMHRPEHRPDPPPSPVRRARSCGGASSSDVAGAGQLRCAADPAAAAANAAVAANAAAAAAAAAAAQLVVLAHEQGASDMDTSDVECSSDSGEEREEEEEEEEESDGSGPALVDGRFVVPRLASLRRHTCSNDTDSDADADAAEVTKDTLEKLRAKALAGAAQLLQEDVSEPRTERDGGPGRPSGPRGASRRHSSHI